MHTFDRFAASQRQRRFAAMFPELIALGIGKTRPGAGLGAEQGQGSLFQRQAKGIAGRIETCGDATWAAAPDHRIGG